MIKVKDSKEYPCMHGGNHDPASSTKFGHDHWARVQAFARKLRVPVDELPDVKTMIEGIVTRIEECKVDDNEGKTIKKEVKEFRWDCSLHAMMLHTTRHVDVPWGDGPAAGEFIGICSNEGV